MSECKCVVCPTKHIKMSTVVTCQLLLLLSLVQAAARALLTTVAVDAEAAAAAAAPLAALHTARTNMEVRWCRPRPRDLVQFIRALGSDPKP